ncbi:PQQ-binding-like beta-propeller repeat protein [Streptomyces sp. NBC_00572]|uniref:outer membrane protein assembly factor BamB family protein n=1 Tax=Streptomyces sp. NBC_00572 TaxID=2903664 RepID=UPI00224E716F|nr:PQQ-binding-like beta-propeller repeat protein [Streptomyces sp. NBC_00572]MCX4980695.1 PQQ-like beta-propeller repeat protein [Streptomyces sp. NBC_00572]
MTREGTAPLTAAVLLSGAAFGAAAAFLGAGVVAGSWPSGWAALGCALALVAAGVTGLVVSRRSRASAEPRDAVPGPDLAKADGRTAPGRSPALVAGVVWLLALAAAGSWGLMAAGDDDDDEEGRAAGKPAATASASTAPPKAAIAWSVPAVGAKHDEGVGAWALDESVAQGRLDGLFAYDSATGAVRWNVSAPAREALCGMSGDTEQGIGLIAHGRHEKSCANLLAVRVSDGKVMWRKTLTGKGLLERGLALGGGTAVTAEDGVVRGRSSETGDQRWQRTLAKGCSVLAVDADATRTLVVEQCGEGARLVALDTRTGAQQWLRELPVESRAVAAVVSVTPVVLAVHEDDKRGTRAFLGFDDKGTPTVTIPLSGPEGQLSAPGDIGDGRTARIVVRDGRLITLAERTSLVPDRIVAYSLTDGRKAWQYASEGWAAALTTEQDGRIAVLEDSTSARVVLLDPATGKAGRVIAPDDPTMRVSIEPELLVAPGGRHIVVNHLLMQAEPSAFAMR